MITILEHALPGPQIKRPDEVSSGRSTEPHPDPDQGALISFVPYLELTESIIAFAISFCAAAVGCTPSSEKSAPKTEVAASRAFAVQFGKAGMAGVAPVR